MRWPGIESIYGPTLRTTLVFGGQDDDGASVKRWDDLHTRVIEHVSCSFSKILPQCSNMPYY